MMSAPGYGPAGHSQVDGVSQAEKVGAAGDGLEKAGTAEETEAGRGADGAEAKSISGDINNDGSYSSPSKPISVAMGPEGENSGEQAHDQRPRASEMEEDYSDKSPICIAPSDDAPISRIEMNDGDYQNIIQYSEVMSKDQQSQHQQRQTNRRDATRRSFHIDTTAPQEEQLN